MAFTFNFGGFNPDWFNPANFNGNQEGEAEGGQQSHQNPFAQRPKKERKPRKAIGNAFTRTLINLGVTILFALVYFSVLLGYMSRSWSLQVRARPFRSRALVTVLQKAWRRL